MDISKATEKISEITKKVESFNTKIKGIYNTFAEKINKLIDEIEEISNKIANATAQAIIWLEIKLNELLKKLSELVQVATNKINALTKQASEWYEESVKSTKINVVKSYTAKIGKPMSDSAIEGMTSIIPHPSFSSLLPEIKIDLQVPVTQGYNNSTPINLKKIPLL